MIILEISLWILAALLLAGLEWFLAGKKTRGGYYLFAAVLGAVVGGTMARLSGAGALIAGGFSVSSLLVALVFALAAMVIVDILAPRRHLAGR